MEIDPTGAFHLQESSNYMKTNTFFNAVKAVLDKGKLKRKETKFTNRYTKKYENSGREGDNLEQLAGSKLERLTISCL